MLIAFTKDVFYVQIYSQNSGLNMLRLFCLFCRKYQRPQQANEHCDSPIWDK